MLEQELAGGLQVTVIETSSLGDRSYLAQDGNTAVVVDPQRDVDRILALAGKLDVAIAIVLDTHVHNDYVSGGLELARLTGADYAMSASDDLSFDYRGIADGDVLHPAPDMSIRAVHTPGHTYNHLSYVLEGADGPVGVFTGGSLLFGTTGRTDLLGAEHSHELARLQHTSARTLAERLPDGAHIWPTHGFGSFCSAGAVSGDSSTVGDEKQRNPAFRLAGDDFAAETLAGLDVYPAYYVHMGVINTSGPPPIDLRTPAAATPEELQRQLDAGQWVVDLRSRKAYVQSHVAGTVSLGLDGPMTTWLGWMIDWGAALTLLGESQEQIDQAQRELARIGIDRFAAAMNGTPEEMATSNDRVQSMTSASFHDLAHVRGGHQDSLPPADVVLDVRTNNEYRTSHIDGALHIPLYDLPHRTGEVPGGSVWVHCGSGYRAAAAASLLENAGSNVVLIDDSYSATADTDLDMVYQK